MNKLDKAASDGAIKDTQTVTPQGEVLSKPKISGVRIVEKNNIITRSGITTELFSTSWEDNIDPPKHIIQVVLRANAISAWHCHMVQEDRVFCIDGTLKLVLHDARADSSTQGEIDEFLLSLHRPRLAVIPPGVWHGIQNLESRESRFIDMFDQPYRHADPDEWRLPMDTDRIPYRF